MRIRTTTDLGSLVRDQRARRSFTQAQLAALVGVSRKWIIDLEAGKRTADISLVLRTIKALGLEIDVTARDVRDGAHAGDVDEIIERSRRTPR